MHILIVDDHTLVLEGLELLLSTFDYIQQVTTAGSVAEMEARLQEHKPELILLDINLGNDDGRTVCRQLKKEQPELKIIALTSYSDAATVKSSVLAGFDGYLLKSEDRNTIYQALLQVAGGQTFFSPKVQELFFQQKTTGRKPVLTAREQQVLNLIVAEKTTKEIAETLFISEKTVENHRSNLMLKLDAKNMAGLVKKAITLGYL